MRALLATSAFAAGPEKEDHGLPRYPMLVQAEYLRGASIKAVKDLPGSTMNTMFDDHGKLIGFHVLVKPFPKRACRAEFYAYADGTIWFASGLACAGGDPNS